MAARVSSIGARRGAGAPTVRGAVDAFLAAPRIGTGSRSRPARAEPEGAALPRQHFKTEKSLREYLLTNLHEFAEFRGLTGITPEKRMPSGRRLDIVAKRPGRGELVGVELKLGAIDDRAVGQSLQYIDDLAKDAARQNLSAHFCLVAGVQPNPAGKQRIQRHAASLGVAVTILIHHVEMTLTAHP